MIKILTLAIAGILLYRMIFGSGPALPANQPPRPLSPDQQDDDELVDYEEVE
ncbi:MAG: hypothetical protein H6561_14250 [Lewinellaceae bacterium]|nr:hypothetical protein [Saprospiraceae bacterium]MCB9270707.1 hypothetical protein [Lewinellaceae bacterium]HPG05923.1 hypothetical protein [Saprospiraceae bacterium]HQU53426.1 hypothetical protein [Saprospiraceae bacterium]